MSRLVEDLNLDLKPDVGDVAAEIDAFLDPDLKHHAGTQIISNHPAIICALDLHARLTGGGVNQAVAAIDAVAPEAERLSVLTAPWSDALNAMRRAQAGAKAEATLQAQRAANFEREVARLKGTLSWRITSPLRVIQNGWHRLAGKPEQDA
jgi:hypothetical protein